MGKPRVRVIVLCEDQRHAGFVRTFFRAKGLRPEQYRISISPAGKGAAEYFIRNRYSKEIKGFRSKAYQKNICLGVMIDGDGFTPLQRKKQLDSLLSNAEMDRRSDAEKIAVAIPCRNIETWLMYVIDGLAKSISISRLLRVVIPANAGIQ